LELAAFYSAVTGLPVKPGSDESWAGIQLAEIELAFMRVDGYQPPTWPESERPKQFHLDFEVDDVEAEQTRVLSLGATLVQDSVGSDGFGWRVYLDPVGHPFCLCRNKSARWTEDGLTWSTSDQTV
jgi:predicted enzyme related to lactoylglutathione lyase